MLSGPSAIAVSAATIAFSAVSYFALSRRALPSCAPFQTVRHSKSVLYTVASSSPLSISTQLPLLFSTQPSSTLSSLQATKTRSADTASLDAPAPRARTHAPDHDKSQGSGLARECSASRADA